MCGSALVTVCAARYRRARLRLYYLASPPVRCSDRSSWIYFVRRPSPRLGGGQSERMPLPAVCSRPHHVSERRYLAHALVHSTAVTIASHSPLAGHNTVPRNTRSADSRSTRKRKTARFLHGPRVIRFHCFCSDWRQQSALIDDCVRRGQSD